MTATFWAWATIERGRTHLVLLVRDEANNWRPVKLRCGTRPKHRHIYWASDMPAPVCARCWRAMADRLNNVAEEPNRARRLPTPGNPKHADQPKRPGPPHEPF